MCIRDRLLHGGLNLLEKRHTDRAISETVQEWFSVPVTVTFTGKTELQNGDESVIERLHVEEEKRARAAVIEEMDRYEAAMKEKAAKRRVSVREGKSLMPQILSPIHICWHSILPLRLSPRSLFLKSSRRWNFPTAGISPVSYTHLIAFFAISGNLSRKTFSGTKPFSVGKLSGP